MNNTDLTFSPFVDSLVMDLQDLLSMNEHDKISKITENLDMEVQQAILDNWQVTFAFDVSTDELKSSYIVNLLSLNKLIGK